MPEIIKVRDEKTGKTFQVQYDGKPPTADELADIFEQKAGQSDIQSGLMSAYAPAPKTNVQQRTPKLPGVTFRDPKTKKPTGQLPSRSARQGDVRQVDRGDEAFVKSLSSMKAKTPEQIRQQDPNAPRFSNKSIGRDLQDMVGAEADALFMIPEAVRRRMGGDNKGAAKVVQKGLKSAGESLTGRAIGGVLGGSIQQGEGGAASRAFTQGALPQAGGLAGFAAGARVGGSVPAPAPVKALSGLVGGMVGAAGGGTAAAGAQRGLSRFLLGDEGMNALDQQRAIDQRDNPLAASIGQASTALLFGKPTANDIRAIPQIVQMVRGGIPLRVALASPAGQMLSDTLRERAMEAGVEVLAAAGENLITGKKMDWRDVGNQALSGALLPGENRLGRVATGAGSNAATTLGGLLSSQRPLNLDLSGMDFPNMQAEGNPYGIGNPDADSYWPSARTPQSPTVPPSAPRPTQPGTVPPFPIPQASPFLVGTQTAPQAPTRANAPLMLPEAPPVAPDVLRGRLQEQQRQLAELLRTGTVTPAPAPAPVAPMVTESAAVTDLLRAISLESDDATKSDMLGFAARKAKDPATLEQIFNMTPQGIYEEQRIMREIYSKPNAPEALKQKARQREEAYWSNLSQSDAEWLKTLQPGDEYYELSPQAQAPRPRTETPQYDSLAAMQSASPDFAMPEYVGPSERTSAPKPAPVKPDGTLNSFRDGRYDIAPYSSKEGNIVKINLKGDNINKALVHDVAKSLGLRFVARESGYVIPSSKIARFRQDFDTAQMAALQKSRISATRRISSGGNIWKSDLREYPDLIQKYNRTPDFVEKYGSDVVASALRIAPTPQPRPRPTPSANTYDSLAAMQSASPDFAMPEYVGPSQRTAEVEIPEEPAQDAPESQWNDYYKRLDAWNKANPYVPSPSRPMGERVAERAAQRESEYRSAIKKIPIGAKRQAIDRLYWENEKLTNPLAGATYDEKLKLDSDTYKAFLAKATLAQKKALAWYAKVGEQAERNLIQGKPVPPQVLADYPHLVRKYNNQSSPAPTPQPRPRPTPSANTYDSLASQPAPSLPEPSAMAPRYQEAGMGRARAATPQAQKEPFSESIRNLVPDVVLRGLNTPEEMTGSAFPRNPSLADVQAIWEKYQGMGAPLRIELQTLRKTKGDTHPDTRMMSRALRYVDNVTTMSRNIAKSMREGKPFGYPDAPLLDKDTATARAEEIRAAKEQKAPGALIAPPAANDAVTSPTKEPWQMSRDEWFPFAAGKMAEADKAQFPELGGDDYGAKTTQLAKDFLRYRDEYFTPEKEAERDRVAKYSRDMGVPSSFGSKYPDLDYAARKSGYFTDSYLNHLRQHRIAVEKALSEGKPVPKSVIAEYPDLAAKYQKPTAPKPAPLPSATPGKGFASRVTEEAPVSPAPVPEVRTQAPEVQQPKQPWEMSRREFNELEHGHKTWAKYPGIPVKAFDGHSAMIEWALKNGKPVPQEILDLPIYRDIANKLVLKKPAVQTETQRKSAEDQKAKDKREDSIVAAVNNLGGYDAALKSAQKRQAEATANGDMAAFESAQKDLEALASVAHRFPEAPDAEPSRRPFVATPAPEPVRFAIDVPAKNVKTSAMNPSLSAGAFKGADALYFWQGDIGQILFNAKATVGVQAPPAAAIKEASLYEAAQNAGYRRANYRAGNKGTVWVMEKDGKILTRRGAEALAGGQVIGRVEDAGRGRESAQPIINQLGRFLDSLPDSTIGNLGALTTAFNRTPLASQVRINRSDNGRLRVDAYGPGWYIYEPETGTTPEGRFSDLLDSSVPRFVEKLRYMASNPMGEGENAWLDQDRAADKYALERVPAGGDARYLGEKPPAPVQKPPDFLTRPAEPVKKTAESVQNAPTPEDNPTPAPRTRTTKAKLTPEEALAKVRRERENESYQPKDGNPFAEELAAARAESQRVKSQRNMLDRQGRLSSMKRSEVVGGSSTAKREALERITRTETIDKALAEAKAAEAKLAESARSYDEAPTPAPTPEPKPAPAPQSAPASNEPVTLASHAQFFRELRANGITPEGLLKQYERTLDSKAAIVAELNKKTVAELNRFVYARPGEKKADIIDRIFRGVLDSYTLDKTVSWQPFSETYEQASRRVLEGLTQADIDSYREKRKDALKAKEKEEADTASAIENPQTYEDFRTLLRLKGIASLTPEQKRTYEDLLAEKTKADRKAQTPTRPASPAPSGQSYAITEHFHSKRGANVYIAAPAGRMEEAEYKSELARAKALGGYYSRAWQGSPGGFAFKTNAEATAFVEGSPIAPKTEETSTEDGATSKNPISERMRATAERMEEAANESLNRDRKANTAKRASQAASAEASANYDLRVAKTMRTIADAIENGTVKYLDGVKSRAVIETLDQIVRSAKWDSGRKKGEKTDDIDGRTATIEDMDNAEYPYPGLRRGELKAAIAELSKSRVSKAKLATLGMASVEGEVVHPKKIVNLPVAEVITYTLTRENRAALGYPQGIPDTVYVYKIKPNTQPGLAAGEGGFVYTTMTEPILGKLSVSPTLEEAAVGGVRYGERYYTAADADVDKWISIKNASDIALLQTVNRLPDWQVDRFKRLQAADIKTPAELKAALREYLGLVAPAPASDPIKKAERELIGRKIPGYFPTPPALVEKMLGYADIQPGMSVLEPSAGKGNIADAIKEAHPDAQISAIEPVETLRTILEAKGYELVGRDFLQHEGEYDRIVMNPPFEDGQDMAHVRHAYDLLKPGGTLVAITSEGPFFRSDKKAQEFRQWLEETGATDEKNPDKSFMDSERSTGVATRMVTIEKPANAPRNARTADTLKEEASAQEEVINGLKVYPTSLKLGGVTKDYWSVQSPENAGTERKFGDTLFLTKEEAIREAARVLIKTATTAPSSPTASLTSEEDAFQGFTNNVVPMAAARIKKALSLTMRFNGEIKTRAKYIEQSINDGAKVKNIAHRKAWVGSREVVESGRILEHPSGSYMTEDTLTKTGMDYAEYLIQKSAPANKTPETFTRPEEPVKKTAESMQEGKADAPTNSPEKITGYTIEPYRYAKDSIVIRGESLQGFKNRADEIAEEMGARYVDRAKGYVMPASKEAAFRDRMAQELKAVQDIQAQEESGQEEPPAPQNYERLISEFKRIGNSKAGRKIIRDEAGGKDVAKALIALAETQGIGPIRGVTEAYDYPDGYELKTENRKIPTIKTASPEKAARSHTHTDPTRNILLGILYDAKNQNIVATDTHRAFVHPAKVEGETRVIGSDGQEIQGTFPNYSRIVPRELTGWGDIDATSVLKSAHAAMDINKERENSTGSTAVIRYDSAVGPQDFNPKYIADAITSLVQTGAKRIQVAERDVSVYRGSTIMVMSGDNGAYVVLMPLGEYDARRVFAPMSVTPAEPMAEWNPFGDSPQTKPPTNSSEKKARAVKPTTKRDQLKAAQAQEAENLKSAVDKAASRLYSNPLPDPAIISAAGKWLAYEVAIRGIDTADAFRNQAEAIRTMADEFGDWVTLHQEKVLESAREFWQSDVVRTLKESKANIPTWIEGEEALGEGDAEPEVHHSQTQERDESGKFVASEVDESDTEGQETISDAEPIEEPAAAPSPEEPKASPKPAAPVNPDARKLLTIAVQQEIGDELGEDITSRDNLKRTWADTFVAASEDFDALRESATVKALSETPGTLSDEERVVAAQLQKTAREKVRELLDKGDLTPEEEGTLAAAIADAALYGRAIVQTGSELGRGLNFSKALMDDAPGGFMRDVERASTLAEGKLSQAQQRALLEVARQGERVQAEVALRLEERAQANIEAAQEMARAAVEEAKATKPEAQTESAAGVPVRRSRRVANPKSASYGRDNTVFTKDRYEAALAKLRKENNPTRRGATLNLGISAETVQALMDIGGFHFEAGLRQFSEWSKQVRSDVGDVAEAHLQSTWLDVKAQSAENRPKSSPPSNPSTFVDILESRIGRENARKFLDAITEDDGEPALLQKLIDGSDLTESERKTIADAYRTHSPKRKAGGSTVSTKRLSEILIEFRKKSGYRPKPLTNAQVLKRANDRLGDMAQTGKAPTVRPRTANPLIDQGVAEYAKGARNLEAFTRGLENRLGTELPEPMLRDLFKEAARRYSVEKIPIKKVRQDLSRKIEAEVLKTKPLLTRKLKALEAYRSAMRSIVTSVDFSGLGNQGGILAVSRPSLAVGGGGRAGAIRHMIESARSEENLAMLTADIESNQATKYGDKDFYKKAGLELSETGAGAELTSKEENFLSNMASKIPLVAGSERAYSAVLNSLRSATFDALYQPGMSMAEAKDLARYINVASGRGDLSHSLKMATPMLANIFFSPRYGISRVQYLVAQPLVAASTSRTRAIIAKEYARYLSKIALAISLGIAGGLVKSNLPEKDKDGNKIPPLQRAMLALTNSETGVFKIPVPGTAGGEIYFDFYSSNKQWITFAATLLSGQKVGQNGKLQDSGALDTAGRMFRSKLAPDLGMAVNWSKDRYGDRTDFIGNPTTVEGTLRGQLPMSFTEVIKGFAEIGTQPAEANKIMVGLGLVTASVLSAAGFKANYRNKTQEQAERETAKAAKKTDPLYHVLDQASPLRSFIKLPPLPVKEKAKGAPVQPEKEIVRNPVTGAFEFKK